MTSSLHQKITEALYKEFGGLRFDADIVDAVTGEILIPCGRTLTKTLLRRVAERAGRLYVLPGRSRHAELLPLIQSIIHHPEADNFPDTMPSSPQDPPRDTP